MHWVGGVKDDNGTHPRLLPESKFNRFKQLFTTPVETVELTDAMFTKLNRVFDAEDSHREYEFAKEGLDDDFIEFYNPQHFWSTRGAAAARTAINSVWVADLPETQVGNFPQPYGYIVDIASVKDIYNNDSNECQWVMFVSGDYLFVYDDILIRKFIYKDGEIGEVIGEFSHELGYTPARQIWTDKLTLYDNINKKSPITNVLTSLDHWLFMSTNKKYMDLGSSYPITVSYEMGEDDKEDNKSKGTKQPSGGDLLGPATHVQIPLPSLGENDLMASTPIQVIAPDVSSLEYHSGMLLKKKEQIFENVVGREDDRNNDQAKNELQVQQAVESREEVMMRYKSNYEIIESFSSETLARLRYDMNFKGLSVDYGSQFFLKSLSGLQEDYNEAKEAGSDPVILEDIKNSIINLRYRNNPSGKLRADLITDLTPFRDKTVTELIDLHKEGLVDEIDLQIRINLLDFIARFEREEAPLNVFGKKLEYNKQLQAIRETLVAYAKEKSKPSEPLEGMNKDTGLTNSDGND